MKRRQHLAEVCCRNQTMRWLALCEHNRIAGDRIADTIWVNAGHMFRAETASQAPLEHHALARWRAVWQRNDDHLHARTMRFHVLREAIRLAVQGIEQDHAVNLRAVDTAVL